VQRNTIGGKGVSGYNGTQLRNCESQTETKENCGKGQLKMQRGRTQETASPECNGTQLRGRGLQDTIKHE